MLTMLALAIIVSAQESTSAPSQTVRSQLADRDKESVVEGMVVKEPGSEPLKKVIVNMIGEDQEKSGSYTSNTDAAGRFRMEKVQPGRYTVLIEKTGYLAVDAKRHPNSSSTLTVQAGQDLKDLVFRMLPVAVISGGVVDEDGDPMPGVEVSALHYAYTSGRRSLEAQGSTRTDDLGEYRMAGLPPGKYIISATPATNFQSLGMKDTSDVPGKPDLAYVPMYYPNSSDRSQAVPLDVHPGDELPVSFNMSKTNTFRVRGTIAGVHSKQNQKGVVVLRSNDSESIFNAAEVENDGKFELRSVAPGSYTIGLMMVDREDTVLAQSTVEVTHADLNNVTLVPAPPARIQGRVLVEGSRKLDYNEIWVALRPADDVNGASSRWSRQEESSPIAKDGTFEIKQVIPGTYDVEVTCGSRNKEFFAKKVISGGKDLSESSLRVSAGANIAMQVLLASGGATVDGLVKDSKDQPASNVTVVAVPDAEHRKARARYMKVTTDQRGHFTMRGLVPGEYTIVAWEDIEDGAYYDPEFIKKDEGSGKSLRVTENSTQSITLKSIPADEDRQP